MKNYWLISGGITIGFGISALASKENEDKTMAIFQIIGGTAVVLVGIYGFKK